MIENWKPVLRLKGNEDGRDFVCGDIHGCFDKVEFELTRNGFDTSRDRLFCVGDLIDRGPHSELALEYLKKPWFYSARGNHEQMYLLANLKNGNHTLDIRNHIYNGGDWAYENSSEFREKLFHAILDNIPLIIQVRNTLIVHAALPDVKSLRVIEQFPSRFIDEILWARHKIPGNIKIQGIQKIFVGHSIVEEPKTWGKITNIDTGAFLVEYGEEGKLTMLEMFY
jgi:serine/threonine protein phosphatase 1